MTGAVAVIDSCVRGCTFAQNGASAPRFLGDIVLRRKPAGKCGNRGVVRSEWLRPECGSRAALSSPSSSRSASGILPAAAHDGPVTSPARLPSPLFQWSGLPVRSISFEGVTADRLDPLPGHLAQLEGKPLRPGRRQREPAPALFHRPLRDHSGARAQAEIARPAVSGPDLSRHPAHLYRHGRRLRRQGAHLEHATAARQPAPVRHPLYPGQTLQRPRADAPDHGRKWILRAQHHADSHPAPQRAARRYRLPGRLRHRRHASARSRSPATLE